MIKRYGCLSLFLVLLFGAVWLYRASWDQTGNVPAFSQLPEQTQRERRANAQSLVAKVEEIAKSARQKNAGRAKKPFVIEASEEQLNTLLQDRLRTEKFPISNLSVGLEKDLLTAQGIAEYSGIKLPATLSGTLQAKNGALHFEIQSLGITGVPTPGGLRDKAQQTIESGLQKLFAGRDRVRVESVAIMPDKITIRGQTG